MNTPIPHRQPIDKKSFRLLKLLGFLVPVAFVLLLELGRILVLEHRLNRAEETIVAVTMLAVGAVLFSHRIFEYIDGVHGEVSRRSDQLATLYKTGVAINSTLGLKETVQLIIDEARVLLGASVGELVLRQPILDLNDSGHAVYFSGFDFASCRVSSKAMLAGLNGEVLRSGHSTRVAHRVKHPCSVTLPPGHFQFDALLSVPLKNASGEIIGAITLVKDIGLEPFSEDDEALLINFSNQAAIAIINASLYEQVRYLTVLEERERIARGMHDGLGQIFAYMSIGLKIVDDLLAMGKVEEAQKRLAPLREAAESTSVDVRETIVNLRTPLLPQEDLLDALNKYLKDFSERNEIKVNLNVEQRVPDFPRLAQIQIICIIQEALANVRKHAQASEITVDLFAHNGSKEVWVADNGRGFSQSEVPSHGQHLGLTVMEERAKEAGGRLEIKSDPGEGTRVGIIFPSAN